MIVAVIICYKTMSFLASFVLLVAVAKGKYLAASWLYELV